MISDLLMWARLLRSRLLNPPSLSQKKTDAYQRAPVIPVRNLVKITLLGWFSVLGFDFFLHAGLLSRIYLEPSPFLLPPERMFKLIPLSYLSFLLMTVWLCWLMVTCDVVGGLEGSVFGLKLGGLMGGGATLGLASISTAEYSFLCGWFIGQTIELGIAGAVVGSALGGTSLKRLSIMVSVLVVFSLIITVVLQAVGLAPAALVITPK